MIKTEKEIPDVLYTVHEAAKVLKTNSNTMYKLIREGKIQALKLGRLKIPYFELQRFLYENLGKDLSQYVC